MVGLVTVAVFVVTLGPVALGVGHAGAQVAPVGDAARTRRPGKQQDSPVMGPATRRDTVTASYTSQLGSTGR